MIVIEPVKAFSDNYIWLFYDTETRRAAVVDPGDAAPVKQALADRQLTLTHILVTHHHADHIGGLAGLTSAADVEIFGPEGGHITLLTHTLADGDQFSLLGIDFTTLAVPGHTLDHLAFFTANLGTTPVLFCGDTLFAGGCGRIFEGNPEMMLNSLTRLAQLPANTALYCAHEYTLSNLRFAAAVEPDNRELQQRLETAAAMREVGAPTVPSTLALELATNPFLRSDQAAVKSAAETHCRMQCEDNLSVFATVRSWKDHF